MPESSPSPAVAPATASPAVIRNAAFAALALGLVVCLVGYLALTLPGAWFGGARDLRWSAAELSVMRGAGAPVRDGLALSAPDRSGTVV